MNAKDLFNACLEAPAEERRRLLDTAAPAMRSEVLRLLDALSEDPDFLEPELPVTTLGAPRSIGEFKIAGVLGEGGMGLVYRAQQERPRRDVALKVLPAARVGGTRLLRFEAEAEALGRLQHPSITQIFAAGVVEESGARIPYIAMELIEGEDLVRWGQGRSLEEKLAALGAICEGVHCAHERGIIHRDLKPSNILVDGEGRPKILDFGVARFTDGSREFTRSGEIIGTLAYMSPEQARGRDHEVDTRSDQYALGALAYELVTGQVPVEVRGLSLTEAARRIAEEVPRAPRITGDGISRDLDVVISKALAKDPKERYPSVSAFAEDLRRVREREPILGRPPTLVRSLLRLARRHRLAASVASVLLVSGLVLLIVLQESNRELRAARNAADKNLRDARAALGLANERQQELERVNGRLDLSVAEAERARSEAEAAASEALRDRERAVGIERAYEAFFTGESLGTHWRKDTSLESLAATFGKFLDHDFKGTAAAKGSLFSVAAKIYLGFEDWERARKQAAKAIEAYGDEGDEVSTYGKAALLKARVDHGRALRGLRRNDEALSEYAEARRLLATIPDIPGFPMLSASLLTLSASLLLDEGKIAEGRELCLEALANVREGGLVLAGYHVRTRLDLAGNLWRLGRKDAARELLNGVLKGGEGLEATREVRVLALVELALIELDGQKLDAAEEWIQKAFALLDDTRDPIPTRMAVRATQMVIFGDRGRFAEALKRSDEMLKLHEAIDDPLWRARTLTNRGVYLQGLKRDADAGVEAARAIALLEALPQTRPVRTQLDHSLNVLCFSKLARLDFDGALAAMNRCRGLRKELYGLRASTWLDCEYTRAIIHAHAGRPKEGARILVELQKTTPGGVPESHRALVERALAHFQRLVAITEDAGLKKDSGPR